jgi:6-pyruvoyl-tetrahydropterin synthase
MADLRAEEAKNFTLLETERETVKNLKVENARLLETVASHVRENKCLMERLATQDSATKRKMELLEEELETIMMDNMMELHDQIYKQIQKCLNADLRENSQAVSANLAEALETTEAQAKVIKDRDAELLEAEQQAANLGKHLQVADAELAKALKTIEAQAKTIKERDAQLFEAKQQAARNLEHHKTKLSHPAPPPSMTQAPKSKLSEPLPPVEHLPLGTIAPSRPLPPKSWKGMPPKSWKDLATTEVRPIQSSAVTTSIAGGCVKSPPTLPPSAYLATGVKQASQSDDRFDALEKLVASQGEIIAELKKTVVAHEVDIKSLTTPASPDGW